jgi:hypothetical protein
VRARVVLGVALLLVLGALVLDMSGRAGRTAGSDHTSAALFSASVPGGGTLCQPVSPLPEDAAQARLLIGTYGHPVPQLRLSFLDARGDAVAVGHTAAGGREGYVTIPLARVRNAHASAKVCLHVGGSSMVALGGEGGAINPSSEVVNGAQQAGRIALLYLRHGDESWWQLLPVLSRRFGLGKASFFGDWTLPVAALLLLGVWVVTVRLLARELT